MLGNSLRSTGMCIPTQQRMHRHGSRGDILRACSAGQELLCLGWLSIIEKGEVVSNAVVD